MLAFYRESCVKNGTVPIGTIEAQLMSWAEADENNKAPSLAFKVKNQPMIKGDCRALAAVVRRSKSVHRVDIVSCGVDDNGVAELLPAIAESSSITVLNLSHNGLSATKSHVSKMLIDMPELRSLNLSHNDLGRDTLGTMGGDLVWSGKRIGEVTCRLTKLNLSYVNMSTPAVLSLAFGLRRNTTITHLSLSGNNINATACKAIAASLEANTVLKAIDLASNRCQTFGAQSIAAMLQRNVTLEKLMLWDNDIGVDGVQSLFVALSSNRHLVYLDVGRNRAGGDLAVRALKRALSVNRSLRTLGLASCGFGSSSAITFAEGLADNFGLRRLDLRSNPIRDGGLFAIEKALGPPKNVTLFQLELDDAQKLGDADAAVTSSTPATAHAPPAGGGNPIGIQNDGAAAAVSSASISADALMRIRALLAENKNTAVPSPTTGPSTVTATAGETTRLPTSVLAAASSVVSGALDNGEGGAAAAQQAFGKQLGNMQDGFSFLWNKMSTDGVDMAHQLLQKGRDQVERSVEKAGDGFGKLGDILAPPFLHQGDGYINSAGTSEEAPGVIPRRAGKGVAGNTDDGSGGQGQSGDSTFGAKMHGHGVQSSQDFVGRGVSTQIQGTVGAASSVSVKDAGAMAAAPSAGGRVTEAARIMDDLFGDPPSGLDKNDAAGLHLGDNNASTGGGGGLATSGVMFDEMLFTTTESASMRSAQPAKMETSLENQTSAADDLDGLFAVATPTRTTAVDGAMGAMDAEGTEGTRDLGLGSDAAKQTPFSDIAGLMGLSIDEGGSGGLSGQAGDGEAPLKTAGLAVSDVSLLSSSSSSLRTANTGEGSGGMGGSSDDIVTSLLDGFSVVTPTAVSVGSGSVVSSTSRPPSATLSAMSSLPVDLGDEIHSVATSGDNSVEKALHEDPVFLTDHFGTPTSLAPRTPVLPDSVKSEAQKAIDDIFGDDDF